MQMAAIARRVPSVSGRLRWASSPGWVAARPSVLTVRCWTSKAVDGTGSPNHASASASSVLLEEQAIASGVVTWTLNRPTARNALSLQLLQALQAAQQRLRATSKSSRVLILRAAGPVFSAGHDLKEMAAMTADQQAALMDLCAHVMMGFRNLPQPVIAQVGGLATAAGCQLVASCDLVYASAQAAFATPGVNIGLFCSTPAVPLARTVLPRHALELLLTGDSISAQRAYEIGLVNQVLPDAESLSRRVDEIATLVASKSAATLALGKRVYNAQTEAGRLLAAYGVASSGMVDNLQLADAKEGITAFLQKRRPAWQDA